MSELQDAGGHLGDRLSSLVDGELAPDELARARLHLERCETCAHELAEVEGARRMLRGLGTPKPPEGFLSGLVRRHKRLTLLLVAASLIVGVSAALAYALRAPQEDVTPSVRSSAEPTAGPAPARLPAEYAVPSTLAAGYQLVRAELISGGLHVVYRNEVHGLSIFEQPGHLSGVERSYREAEGQVVTWQGGPTVFTAIGDGPAADILAAVRSIPHPHAQSLIGHLRSLSREVVETLSGD
jgi:anti-sigma factor RsiW